MLEDLDEPENTEPLPEGEIGFIHTGQETPEELLGIMLEEATPDEVEETLENVAELELQGQDSGFPGLEPWDHEDSAAILEGLAQQVDEVAAGGAATPIVPSAELDEQQSADTVSRGAFSAAPALASTVLRAVPASLRNTPRLGTKEYNNRTWVMRSKLEHIGCAAFGVFGCRVTDRRSTRISFDPYGSASRVQFSSQYFPSTGRIGKPMYKIQAFRSGRANGSLSVRVQTGTRAKYNLLHRNNNRSSRSVAFRVTGNYKSSGKARSIRPARTGYATCDGGLHPKCTFG